MVENARTAATHRPNRGIGRAREVDYGNARGSILMLAMLNPEDYGIPGACRLKIIDDRHTEGMLQAQETEGQREKPTSSGQT